MEKSQKLECTPQIAKFCDRELFTLYRQRCYWIKAWLKKHFISDTKYNLWQMFVCDYPLFRDK